MSRYPPERAQSAAARALGFSPSAINRFVKGTTGGSIKMVYAVANYLKESPGLILDGDSRMVARVGGLPGFEEALRKARERPSDEWPNVTAAQLEAVADSWMCPFPKRVTAEGLLALATLNTPPRTVTADVLIALAEMNRLSADAR